MKHIWIINQNSGTTLFYQSYSVSELDPDLVSGLLSALNTFSEVELKSHGISSIEMGGMKWVYMGKPDYGILLIAAGDMSTNTPLTKARLEVISKMFIENYNLTPEMFTEGLIKLDQFETFYSTLEILQQQWTQAEKVLDAAAMFDLLAVFQQIYNNFFQMVRLNFFGEKYDTVIQEFKDFFYELQGTDQVQNNTELQKIEFDKQHGWSVININPLLLNEEALKKLLFKITYNLKLVMLKYLSKMAVYYSFSKDIYPYLLSQYELLHRLNINKELLGIFLE